MSKPLVRKAKPVEPPVPAPEVEPSAEDLARATQRDDEQVSRAARPRRNHRQEKPMPHNLEAEKGAICSAFHHPENMGMMFDQCGVTVGHFYSEAHQLIARAGLRLAEQGEFRGLTSSTEDQHAVFLKLSNALQAAGELAKAGGAAEVSSILVFVPSSSNAEYYFKIVREKFALRQLILACESGLASAYEEQLSAIDLVGEVRATIEAVSEHAGTEPERTEEVTFRDLMAFEPKEDPNAVLGYRWLCRGGSSLWIGPSGIGKSVIAMQAGLMWAQGAPLWGVAPVKGRRLKSLFIQAENDLGDMAEMCQGVLRRAPRPAGMPEAEFISQIGRNMVFVRDAVHSGADFARSVARLIAKHKPDLVWIDPLLSYVGDDISNQKVASNFLRNTLNPIAFDTGVVWMVMHHTGKPSTDPKARAHWQDSDMSYAAFGSSELVNWARAVNVLRGLGGGKFEMRFSKRGKRAGLTVFDGDLVDLDEALEGFGEESGVKNERGEFTDRVYLQHAEKGIYWEQIEAPSEEELTKKRVPGVGQFSLQYTEKDILDVLAGTTGGRKAVELQRLCRDDVGMKERTFYSLWKKLKAGPYVDLRDGRFFVSAAFVPGKG